MEIYAKKDFSLDTTFFQEDSNNIQQMINTIDTFCTNSKELLKGEGWDLIRSKLDNYKNSFNSINSITKSLASTIDSSNSSMINALGNYDDVDTSSLDDLITRYNQLLYIAEENRKKTSLFSSLKNNAYDNSINEIRMKIETIKNVKSNAIKAVASLNSQIDTMNFNVRKEK